MYVKCVALSFNILRFSGFSEKENVDCRRNVSK
jgi:hypothetical protein